MQPYLKQLLLAKRKEMVEAKEKKTLALAHHVEKLRRALARKNQLVPKKNTLVFENDRGTPVPVVPLNTELQRYHLRHAALHQRKWTGVHKLVLDRCAEVVEALTAGKNPAPRSWGLRTEEEYYRWMDYGKSFEERLREPLTFRNASVEVVDLTGDDDLEVVDTTEGGILEKAQPVAMVIEIKEETVP